MRLFNRIWSVITTTVDEFLSNRSSEAGAAIAYYALLSIFPLGIFLITILGAAVEPGRVETEIFRFIEKFFPAYSGAVTGLVERNLRSVLESRGQVTALAAITLLWSGSNVFTVLARNINQAWHVAAPPLGIVQGRLMALAIIIALGGLILVSFLADTTLDILAHFESPFRDGGTWRETSVWSWLTRYHLFPPGLIFFVAIYRFVPNTRVRWREAFAGALLTTVAWQFAFRGFTWLARKGLINYQVIYGSLATVVVALFWIYVSGLIVLFGAHLSASIARRRLAAEGDA